MILSTAQTVCLVSDSVREYMAATFFFLFFFSFSGKELDNSKTFIIHSLKLFLW